MRALLNLFVKVEEPVLALGSDLLSYLLLFAGQIPACFEQAPRQADDHICSGNTAGQHIEALRERALFCICGGILRQGALLLGARILLEGIDKASASPP